MIGKLALTCFLIFVTTLIVAMFRGRAGLNEPRWVARLGGATLICSFWGGVSLTLFWIWVS